MEITNCHTHSFTSRHTPDRFLPWPVCDLARFAVVRRLVGLLARLFDPDRQSPLGRYAQILETSFRKSQQEVFEMRARLLSRRHSFCGPADGHDLHGRRQARAVD